MTVHLAKNCSTTKCGKRVVNDSVQHLSVDDHHLTLGELNIARYCQDCFEKPPLY